MTSGRLELSRAQVLAHRRGVGALDARLPAGEPALRRAAWAGLQDSVPRAALLAIHARIEGTAPSAWEDPSLVQVWGPRFTAFVVAAADRGLFTLGRLPDDATRRRLAHDLADRVDAFLDGRRMPFGDVGRALGVPPNSLRYAAPTGRVLIRWDGARQAVIWTVPAPELDPAEARLELARRFLHVFGPTTPGAFAEWAGIPPAHARAAFAALGGVLTPARSPVGDAVILQTDEASFRDASTPPSAVRLLPSGDPYYLLQGAERELLVPDAGRRGKLWTTRVWPGALLVDGEIAGTWRRAGETVTISPWRTPGPAERDAVEAEATALPLPDPGAPLHVRWDAAN